MVGTQELEDGERWLTLANGLMGLNCWSRMGKYRDNGKENGNYRDYGAGYIGVILRDFWVIWG